MPLEFIVQCNILIPSLEDTPKTPIEDKAMIKTEDMQAYATNLQAISTSITSYTKN